MLAGLERISRWLEDVGVRGVAIERSSTSIVLRGGCCAGEARLVVSGLTPNSLYSTGEFVPLTLRLDLGERPSALDAFGARTEAGALWMTAIGRAYRGAVLSGLDPLSPLNQLTDAQIDRFMAWATDLMAEDRRRALRAALDACLAIRCSMGLWNRVRAPWLQEQEQADLASIDRSLRRSRLFDSVTERPPGRVGPIVVGGYGAAVRSSIASGLRVEVDRFSILVPQPSLAIDDLVADIDGLRGSVDLLPDAWVVVRICSDRDVGLVDVDGLHEVGSGGEFACWMPRSRFAGTGLDALLVDLRRRVRTRLAGPYR